MYPLQVVRFLIHSAHVTKLVDSEMVIIIRHFLWHLVAIVISTATAAVLWLSCDKLSFLDCDNSDLSIEADQSIDFGVRKVHEMAAIIKRLLNDGGFQPQFKTVYEPPFTPPVSQRAYP